MHIFETRSQIRFSSSYKWACESSYSSKEIISTGENSAVNNNVHKYDCIQGFVTKLFV